MDTIEKDSDTSVKVTSTSEITISLADVLTQKQKLLDNKDVLSNKYNSQIADIDVQLEKLQNIIDRFLLSMPIRFHVASGDVRLNGAFLEIDEASGKAKRIERVQRAIEGYVDMGRE